MAAFRDMEEVSQGLLSLLGANRAEAQQRRLLGRHEQVVERLLETQDSAEQRLREILAMEEEVAQSLLDAKERAHQGGVELQQLQAELQKAGEDNTRLKASLLQLTRELEELKEIEASLERQEREVDEDTTVTIPSAVYVAQLYHRISKIEWDYESEPGMVKGIHHGPSVAQPIHLDSTQLSKKFISDYLWSLVDTDW
ncbi:kinetochore protein Spc24 [Ursus americanus]|uniref:Kinetochore protein Spc24 n=1 Tax=Ursus maritimus TaxID=29073 RepID=A0A384DGZ5_URSMA|nr:kinetochore protein Spc24 isoform X1 [Ursus maritimus]XP_045630499.1 kinetochore protein Spc24 [Ursus americanus]XP_048083063.2 kinetochore protein Spc24 [Ursus arctos]